MIPVTIAVLSCCSSISAAARRGSRSCSGRSWSSGSVGARHHRGDGDQHDPQVLSGGQSGLSACRCSRIGRGFALAIIGAVFLSITGGEALYADMGHFGKRPVRRLVLIVWPALIINYFGQGALLLETGHPDHASAVWAGSASVLPWMVILATAATVIASQATISGAFSMARQAVQLDLLPRMRVLQTSARRNRVRSTFRSSTGWCSWRSSRSSSGFGSSDALGGAYGAAVVGTMVVTTILGSFVAATQWNWPKWRSCAVRVAVPGRWRVRCRQPHQGAQRRLDSASPGRDSVHDLHDLAQRAARVARGVGQRWPCRAASWPSSWPACTACPAPGCSWRASRLVPSALIRNIEHNGVVHQRVIILKVEIADTPRQDPVRRVRIEESLPGCTRSPRASASWRRRTWPRR